jgi:hypothetical protein
MNADFEFFLAAFSDRTDHRLIRVLYSLRKSIMSLYRKFLLIFGKCFSVSKEEVLAKNGSIMSEYFFF